MKKFNLFIILSLAILLFACEDHDNAKKELEAASIRLSIARTKYLDAYWSNKDELESCQSKLASVMEERAKATNCENP